MAGRTDRTGDLRWARASTGAQARPVDWRVEFPGNLPSLRHAALPPRFSLILSFSLTFALIGVLILQVPHLSAILASAKHGPPSVNQMRQCPFRTIYRQRQFQSPESWLWYVTIRLVVGESILCNGAGTLATIRWIRSGSTAVRAGLRGWLTCPCMQCSLCLSLCLISLLTCPLSVSLSVSFCHLARARLPHSKCFALAGGR